MKSGRALSGSIWPAAGLSLSLFVPSTAVIQRYLGLSGVVVYLIVASLLLALAIVVLYGSIWQRVKDPWIPWLAALTIVLILLLVLLMFPLANSGRLGGGSDGDEALMIAATDLLQGRFPYYQQTYLGNPISPLPGALILAVPFVLLGNVAFQNVFWLAAFYWVSGRFLRDRRQALLLLWTTLLLSPAILQQLATGGDYLANSIYVLVFALWVIYTRAAAAPTWQKLLAAVLLGIALSSRANFLLILPLVFSAITARAGWKEALKATAVTVLSFALVTLPVYLWNPAAFSPLHTGNELGQFRDVLPAAGTAIPLLSALLALVLALRDNGRMTQFLTHAALVQAFPVLCGILLTSMRVGALNFSFARFGIFFLFFGVLAAWPGVWHLTKNQ